MYARLFQLTRLAYPGGLTKGRRLRELEKTQWLARAELERWQLTRLQRLVKYAFDHVPYYRQQYQRLDIHPEDIKTLKDFETLPFLTREDVNENQDLLVSPRLRSSARPNSSGGSTGEPMPWELALMTPLDPSRPVCLGAQVALGRWWREGPNAGGPSGSSRRAAPTPPARIDMGTMAVMVGKYKAETGLRALPEAEQEGKDLVGQWQAIAMTASSPSLISLLEAKVTDGFNEVGAVDAMHFAGHGDFDATRPDGAMMFLSDGRPLSSLLFRSAKYGEAHTPLAFFNACMIGIGGELLGDAGDFPGNCLRGGFGGVLGALWEVDDALARQIANEFWKRALPAPGCTMLPTTRLYLPNSCSTVLIASL